MRKLHRLLAIATSLALLASLAGTAAAGAPPQGDAPSGAPIVDNLPHPLGDAQAANRQSALESSLLGKNPQAASGASLKASNGQFVDFPVNRTDRIFVVIAEFGNQIHPSYGGTPGPVHNLIPAPDRSVDNTTIWQADYNQAHYEDMYFNQMVAYYKAQSSGRYTFNGAVTDWVRVPFNEARYGSNYCGDSVCPTVWYLIRDAVNIWVADKLEDGESPADITAELAEFDIYDRYDHDGDANFDEPDGYIDHFQIVHAGEGEETGGGAQGSNAIWSHRWYTAYQGIGIWGPSGNLLGGMEIGGAGTFANEGGLNATGLWVGDYTMQPENGGLGVFAHEYAHDLGLPDQYDTAGGDNSTAFWTIMSSGSYGSDGNPVNGIGGRPVDFNAWEKLQLGWLKYEVAFAGAKSAHILGPAERTTRGAAQGLIVILPDKEVATNLGDPAAGSAFYYSDAGNNLDNSMSRSVTLPAAPVSLTAQVRYEIELDYDYAYLTVDGVGVQTNLSSATNPNNANLGQGITGSSGGNWVALTADLSAFAGGIHDIGFRYKTDAFEAETGFQVDEIAINGAALGDNETAAGWTLNGFFVSDGLESEFVFNAYVVENRQYLDYDRSLQTGPYNFGFLDDDLRQNWVEHFPYQDGLLISYWDSSQLDNNTSQHPGHGLILPIDAHPDVYYRPDDNAVLRARYLSYDSTFSIGPTEAITLHFSSEPLTLLSKPGVRLFNDANSYWSADAPLASVIVPNTGTTIRIASVNSSARMTIHVNK